MTGVVILASRVDQPVLYTALVYAGQVHAMFNKIIYSMVT